PSEIFDRYFPVREPGTEYYIDPQSNAPANPIFTRYLEKLPRIAKQIGKKYGVMPILNDPQGYQGPPADTDFIQHFDDLNDIDSFIANFSEEMSIETYNRVSRLRQAVENKYGNDKISPAQLLDLYEQIGLTSQDIEDVVNLDFRSDPDSSN